MLDFCKVFFSQIEHSFFFDFIPIEDFDPDQYTVQKNSYDLRSGTHSFENMYINFFVEYQY